MISDVLVEAILEIERYQQRRKDMYSSLEPDIEECKTAMRTLLVKLDTVPQIRRQPEIGKAVLAGAIIAGGAYLLSRFADKEKEPVEVTAV